MSYIEPNSTIQFYRLHGLDPDYNDTLYFENRDAQTTWFDSATSYLGMTVTNYTYQRVRRNRIRIQIPNSDYWSIIYQCSYMRFKNTSYENKWFYAFVTGVDYINDKTAEVTYQIDVMQTWFVGQNAHIGMRPSYVIRQHVSDDSVGANIEPEPVELNEYTTSGTLTELGANSVGYVVAIVDTNQQTSGGISGGVYSGATLYYYENASNIDSKVNEYLQHPESVIAIYTVPKLTGTTDGTNITSLQGAQKDVNVDAVTTSDDIDGYTPKNHKCYTYPYNYLRCFTYEGNYADFRYEYFSGSPRFGIYWGAVQPVKAVLFPENYKQEHATSTTPLPTEGLAITSYPMCSWNSDTYASWVAQNSVPMNNMKVAQEEKVALRQQMGIRNAGIGAIGETLGALGTLMTGNIVGAVSKAGMADLNAFNEIANTNTMNKISNIDFNTSMQNAQYSASIQADTIHGSIGSGNSTLAMGRPGFYAVRVYQKQQVIKKVDDFFTLYGYAVNRLQVPNIHTRSHWTYCRVSDIQLQSAMPADALAQIKKIFSDGVRFWVNESEIGNYTLDNSILS